MCIYYGLWNVLCFYRVSENYLVKIADFGMSKDVYTDNYYRESSAEKPKPVRWMSIESLREGVYNSKTEVVGFINTTLFSYIITYV